MPDGSSLPVLDDLHGLSDTAAVADAAVSAACEIADAANSIGDNTISKNDDHIEATSGWPSVVTDSAPTMQSGQAVATALHSGTSNTIMDVSQPVTGGDDVSAFYSQSYSTVNDLASYDDPQTSNGIYAHAFATTVPLSTDGLPVAGDNNLQLRGESLDPSVYPGTDLGQKPFNGHGMEQPIPFDDAHQPLQVSSSQQWDVYAEKTSFGAGVSEQHALDDFAEGVDEAHSGVAYSTVSQAATPQYASGFNSGVTSNRPSTEIPYYGREPSVASHATGSHDGISDPLGRLNACYPIVAFGFGGKFASMFPKNVQRLNMYDSGKASRVAPGILSVQKLAKVIPDSPETFLAKDRSSAHADHTSQNVAANDWAKTLSLIIANRTPGDQGAILKLGDCLRDDGRILAAHICYALSLQSKEIFFPDMSQYAHPRAILLGANEFDRDRSARSNTFGLVRTPFSRFYKHTPALIATELYELACALKTASVSDPHQTGGSNTPSNSRPQAIQGSNGASGTGTMQGSRHAPMFCLPHFQAYKLQHAWWLVDCGQTALASRYCDSILGILATLPQGVAVPYIHSSLVQGLRDLRERLSGTGMTSIKAAEMTGDTAALSGASSKSWLARAMPRPSFSSLMTAFDSSIDKFITGADGSRISLESSGTSGKYEVGPDRHSFDRQSQGSSQQQPPPAPHSPPRPLGAVSWGGRTPSPRLATTAATAGSTFEQVGFADAYIPSYSSPRQSMDGRPSNSEFGIQDMGVAEPPRMFTPSNIVSSYADGVSMSVPSQQFVEQTAQPPQWGIPESGSGGSIGSHSQFIDPAAVFGAGGNPVGNHISGMTLSMQPAAPGPAAAATAVEDNSGDEEDMFGFSKRPPPSQTPASGSARQSVDISRKSLSSSSAQTPADTKDGKDNAGKKDSETDDKAGSGVIGMLKSLWGGRKNQANLGEESNFVYDPELKRWVDKNAPDSQNDTGPPPPPPSMMKFQPQSASVPPPSTPVGMASRPGSVLPPHPSTDPSRTGTPVSTLGSRTPSIPPPASTGGAKRRSARAKYVNAM
ncbi:hypothetical protein EV175_002860 [Coemansia sp. RSA 1933]|nr:hypothetical protein EV175_002860 [Coemansia sp. RSA 1933]